MDSTNSKGIDLREKINNLEKDLHQAKKERLSFQKGLDMITLPNSEPSVRDVERWKKYGEFWPDPILLEKYDRIVHRNWKRLSREDWMNFYKWLIRWKSQDIDRLELELERLKRDKDVIKIINLIAEFSKYFSEDTEYSENAIKTYITEWHNRNGISTQRAKAKRVAKKKCNELEQITSDGTFINWETKWTEFHNLRTAK